MASLAILPLFSQARAPELVTDWYVSDFESSVTVQTDSSLLIEERITADCGNLPDKHGIFRVVPTESKTDNGIIKTPISLIGITDFDGNKVPYSESTDNFNHTITWKIGDADKTVTGANYYKIDYLVKNAVRAGSGGYDELYWNLLGNFWDIQIDKFNASIFLPQGINQNNSQVYLYSGDLGRKGNDLANYEWTGNNTLRIGSVTTIKERQGITASVTFPAGIVTPYKPTFIDQYGDYLWLLISFVVFIISYLAWNKYGKDPVVNKTIIPEFEIPENLSPMEMGLLASNGNFSDSLITAAIVDMAVRKQITIEEIAKTGIFGKQDFRLKKTGTDIYFSNESAEAVLFTKIFGSNNEVLLSKLKDNFYKELPEIKKAAIGALKSKELIYASGLTMKAIFLTVAFIVLFGMFFSFSLGNLFLVLSLALSASILLVFGLLMPKRTPKGAQLNWRVSGFKLYMETAEKYRARFNEKENIFEKFLPYAIVFGMTKLWIKKMEEIYGKEYFSNYHPAWYAGSFAGNFNADSFTSQINSISAGIASNIGTSSGASGSGGAGGGGGGGGGGGW